MERPATSYEEMFDDIGEALRLFDAVVVPLVELAQRARITFDRRDLHDFVYEDAAAALEQATGVAFVTAQAFLVEARGARRPDRNELFRKGPQTASGTYIAEVINDAANFWKHAPEWSWDDTDGPLAARTRRRVESMLCDDPNSVTPLHDVLCIIDASGRLDALSGHLRAWAESLRGDGVTLFGRPPPTSP